MLCLCRSPFSRITDLLYTVLRVCLTINNMLLMVTYRRGFTGTTDTSREIEEKKLNHHQCPFTDPSIPDESGAETPLSKMFPSQSTMMRCLSLCTCCRCFRRIQGRSSDILHRCIWEKRCVEQHSEGSSSVWPSEVPGASRGANTTYHLAGYECWRLYSAAGDDTLDIFNAYISYQHTRTTLGREGENTTVRSLKVSCVCYLYLFAECARSF